MLKAILAGAAVVALAAGLVAAMCVLRYYGSEGACGMSAEHRELGATMLIAECR